MQELYLMKTNVQGQPLAIRDGMSNSKFVEPQKILQALREFLKKFEQFFQQSLLIFFTKKLVFHIQIGYFVYNLQLCDFFT